MRFITHDLMMFVVLLLMRIMVVVSLLMNIGDPFVSASNWKEPDT